MKRTNTAVWLEKYQRWQINVQKNGVRRTFSSSTPGRKGQSECNQKADDWIDSTSVSPSTRIESLFDSYIEDMKKTTSRSAWSQYEYYGRCWIKPACGNLKIGSLTEQKLQDAINAAHQKGLSKKTLSNIKGCIMAFLKYCRKNNVTTMRLENISIPKSAPVGERVVLQPSDLKILFNTDETIRYGKVAQDIFINAYRLEAVTGLRPGELAGLEVSDVTDVSISIKRSINSFGEETRGKNDNARRTFALNALTRQILSDQKQMLQELGITSRYVFPDEHGDHVLTKYYYKRWVLFRDHNGMSKASPYELRHTFVSVVKGLPEGILKDLIGHSVEMDTYGVYSHEIDGDQQAAAEMVQDVFSRILRIAK